jgi:hypothetical protein
VLTLVLGTIIVLALTLVAGLTAVVIFLTEIRSLVSQTAGALEIVDERATRLAERMQFMQQATAAAATELNPNRT